jgi:hypothetical protein
LLGVNIFESGDAQVFKAVVAASALDGAPCLLLDYAAGDNKVWGALAGMKDEIREVSPGLYIGLGGMWVSGGAPNTAPFILYDPGLHSL